jgi:predicted Zn-dependent protease with MMP-like domain
VILEFLKAFPALENVLIECWQEGAGVVHAESSYSKRCPDLRRWTKDMKREPFLELVRAALDSLPWKFRKHIRNVAVVVEDFPPRARSSNQLLMGIFEGTPRTEQSFFNVATGPNRIALYQKNIEAHAEVVAAKSGRSVEDAICEEVRLTVLHEFGHYFGLDEKALEDL